MCWTDERNVCVPLIWDRFRKRARTNFPIKSVLLSLHGAQCREALRRKTYTNYHSIGYCRLYSVDDFVLRVEVLVHFSDLHILDRFANVVLARLYGASE